MITACSTLSAGPALALDSCFPRADATLRADTTYIFSSARVRKYRALKRLLSDNICDAFVTPKGLIQNDFRVPKRVLKLIK